MVVRDLVGQEYAGNIARLMLNNNVMEWLKIYNQAERKAEITKARQKLENNILDVLITEKVGQGVWT